GEWSRRATADGAGLVLRSSTGREQVTISVMSSSKRMDSAVQSSTLNRLLEHRRQAESRGADTAVTMTESALSETAGTHTARFSGFEPAAQRRFSCLLACGSSVAITFYYEAVGLSEQEADSRARLILDSVRVSG